MVGATARSASLAAALVFCCLSAQAAELNWAQKMFEKLNHDFGVVARGADVGYRFKITNLYQQPVHITSVHTTCGCSAATPSKNTLASGEEAYVEITMDTQRFIRRKDSNLIVTFDAPQHGEVKIPVTVYIRTDVVLTPGSVNFGAVDHGSEAQRKIEIAYAGRGDWTIKDVRTGSEHLSAKVVETGRGGGRVSYDLLVTLKPTSPVGTVRQQITLVTDDTTNPLVPLMVEAKVEADITVTPELVSLGMLTPGKEKTLNVVLRGKKPFAIEKIECETARRAFKIRLSRKEKLVHVLPLTVTPPDTPGKFAEEFVVTIAGRDEPVTFKAYGTVAE